MSDFTHFDESGRCRMVDVSEKNDTSRIAVAEGYVYVNRETLGLIKSGGIKKGDVLTVAQIAGIMGAKRTPDLIPMCHTLILSGVSLEITVDDDRCAVRIQSRVKNRGATGVEMEALTAVSVSALTVYDMCKAVQKDMRIGDIRLLHKEGGVHGVFHAES
ncbi:cyclic pyranopterin phosphate synthase [Ruminobacter amylophilus]|uniref:Cyclic pyranopterin monophosphate synthase n=1 Tax=Ruminobacter amylophilus TaxID=867 RepID=A0A662ZID2_9GAMM|nr:cyclic pyranopterin monophosphate synthase MoaC [Ruminobacter amylophilus]SFP32159.1 cyclic pyranopterin phosphate synthase [Ruminobacter amylophilus]